MLRLLAALILVGAVMTGCSRRPDAGSAQIAATGLADPQAVAAAAPADDAANQPQVLKAAAAQFAVDELGQTRKSPEGDDRVFIPDEHDQPYLDLIDCDEEGRQFDVSHRKEASAEFAYKRAAIIRQKLKLGGYPVAAFEPVLAAYEDQLIAAGQAARTDNDYAELGRLAAQLEGVREAQTPGLPPIRAEGGCGGAESLAAFRSQPAGARIWLITKFAFDVCKIKGLDSWNPAACDHWTELEPGKGAELSGTYMYQARWPDGAAARGARSIQPASDDLQTFVVSRQ